MRHSISVLVLLLAVAGPISAQDVRPPAPPRPSGAARTASVEGHAGWAGFLDEDTLDHSVLGGAARWRLTPRLAVGPEVTWTRGPGTDRDVFVMGALTADLVAPREGRAMTPYLVVAGGVMTHSSGYGNGTWSRTGAATGGAGARIDVTRHFYLAPEFRVGWEPHARITVAGGWRF